MHVKSTCWEECILHGRYWKEQKKVIFTPENCGFHLLLFSLEME